MTDKEKLDAIRAEIHRLVEVRGYDRGMANDLFAFMDSLPNEPVNGDFEMALAEMIDKAQKCVVEPLVIAEQWKDELIKLAKCEEPVSEKKCMFTKDSYTDEDRKILCEDCDEKCEYSKKEEPVSEPNKELAETYLAVFDKKFPVLPTLKGKQLADYKNFLNKCQQIFSLREWGIRPIQSKLFEKLSLLWAAWGAEHLQGVGRQDEKEQDIPVSEELEKAANEYIGQQPLEDYKPALYKAFIAGAKWKEQQMMAKAIDAHCFGFQGAALFSFRLPADKYLVGSEVKVVVIKEE